MFDALFAGLGESALVAAVEQAGREEAAAGARRLAAIAELVHSTVEDDPERGGWVFDDWNNAACEVGAVLGMSRRRASGQMWIAVALRYRLPKIAALYCQGRLSPRLISEITWRTRLVADEVVAVVDAAIAERAVRWGPLSDARLSSSIEAVIERYDPDAVIRAQEVIRARDLHIGAAEDPNETAAIWGQLLAGDAAALEARIAGLVKGLCADDPRCAGERRSDAMGAIAHGVQHLVCRCGVPTCPGAAAGPVASKVLVRVIADQAAVEAAQHLIATQDREQQQALARKNQAKKTAESAPTPESELDAGIEPASESEPASEEKPTPAETAPEGEPMPTSELTPEDGAVEAGAGDASPASCQRDSGVALLPKGRVLPIAALAEAIRGGAVIKELWLPGPDPEPHYQPSAKLAEFVRARDVFCRFPGCDVPAEHCDIDHVVPWPHGPTHPSNLNCKCRTHHIGKTFWEGWRDVQQPDATVIWTDPIGRSYTTWPGSRLYFPTWNTATAELAPMAQPPPDPDRLAKMPRRRRTRVAERAARIKAEREANGIQRALDRQRATDIRAQCEPAETPPTDDGNDPPPF